LRETLFELKLVSNRPGFPSTFNVEWEVRR